MTSEEPSNSSLSKLAFKDGRAIPPAIAGVFGIHDESTEGEFAETVFALMKELHLSYDDIMNMPIYTFNELVRILKKYYKDQEREMQRIRNRRH